MAEIYLPRTCQTNTPPQRTSQPPEPTPAICVVSSLHPRRLLIQPSPSQLPAGLAAALDRERTEAPIAS